ncbi:MAG: 2-aminoethylphosphonate aminotransferase [Lachnospiraceae bacterium]|nr:2-aminoethylphosphonate aminotransferase [Lachnospiraceae bacterium]
MEIKRNVLLNPGPSTTSDTVKMAQLVPDICPREKEFQSIMAPMRKDLVKIVHGGDDYTSVLFCGSGTICIDVCLNSLLPENKKALVINNGSYSQRAVDVCRAYRLPLIEVKQPIDRTPDLAMIEEALKENGGRVAYVYITYHETGTGLLNPVKEVGALAHKYGAFLITDTTSAYAMIPIDVNKENIDFCMASAQKGIQGMTGLSYVIGRKNIIEESKAYPMRSYYCNLYMQYDFFERTGEMHFTPPVQTIYAARQALKEYREEGEEKKWARHRRIMNGIRAGVDRLGFREALDRSVQSGLVSAIIYPDDPGWDFEKIHDYCYERGFTIYPGKIEAKGTFRLCALGAIDEADIAEFWKVFEAGLREMGVSIPVKYDAQ